MGKVEVTVQTEKRLEAINNLSRAILAVARALESGVHVNISDCVLHGDSESPAVNIATVGEVNETTVKDIE